MHRLPERPKAPLDAARGGNYNIAGTAAADLQPVVSGRELLSVRPPNGAARFPHGIHGLRCASGAADLPHIDLRKAPAPSASERGRAPMRVTHISPVPMTTKGNIQIPVKHKYCRPHAGRTAKQLYVKPKTVSA